ncbi:MAG: hypothetical protein J7480_09640, partial [Microbacteriaceae bacterium]|nr:hypothetical protein [Microbacteriaceae bacterium]
DDTMPTLRLLTTGAGPTRATVAIIPDGATLGEALANPRAEAADTATDAHAEAPPTEPTATSFSVSLSQGAVAELPIEGIAPGEYTVVVTADEPLVGALRGSVTGPGGTDFAWFSPAGSLGDRAVVATPDADSVVLAIANPGDADRTVTLTGPDGDAELVVPGGGSVLVEVEGRSDYSLAGMNGLRAALRADGDGLVAQTPLQPPAPLATPVRVHV